MKLLIILALVLLATAPTLAQDRSVKIVPSDCDGIIELLQTHTLERLEFNADLWTWDGLPGFIEGVSYCRFKNGGALRLYTYPESGQLFIFLFNSDKWTDGVHAGNHDIAGLWELVQQ